VIDANHERELVQHALPVLIPPSTGDGAPPPNRARNVRRPVARSLMPLWLMPSGGRALSRDGWIRRHRVRVRARIVPGPGLLRLGASSGPKHAPLGNDHVAVTRHRFDTASRNDTRCGSERHSGATDREAVCSCTSRAVSGLRRWAAGIPSGCGGRADRQLKRLSGEQMKSTGAGCGVQNAVNRAGEKMPYRFPGLASRCRPWCHGDP
jgi:hypothetical protein